MHSGSRTPRPLGKRIARHKPVVLRIGVEDQPSGLVLLRKFGLDSAESLSITRQRDFPLDANAKRFQFAVILLHPVIHIDHRRRHLAGRRIRVEAGHRPLVVAVKILLEGLLGGGERSWLGSRHFKLHFKRQRQPGAVGDNLGVEPKTAILVAQPLGDSAARVCAGHVRLARQVPQVGLRARGLGYALQLLLELPLALHAGRPKASNAGDFLGPARNPRSQNSSCQKRARPWRQRFHPSSLPKTLILIHSPPLLPMELPESRQLANEVAPEWDRKLYSGAHDFAEFLCVS